MSFKYSSLEERYSFVKTTATGLALGVALVAGVWYVSHSDTRKLTLEQRTKMEAEWKSDAVSVFDFIISQADKASTAVRYWNEQHADFYSTPRKQEHRPVSGMLIEARTGLREAVEITEFLTGERTNTPPALRRRTEVNGSFIDPAARKRLYSLTDSLRAAREILESHAHHVELSIDAYELSKAQQKPVLPAIPDNVALEFDNLKATFMRAREDYSQGE